MSATHTDPEPALCGEILAEARRECEMAVSRAREQAAILLQNTRASAEKIREEQLAGASAEGLRRKNVILSTLPAEIGRLQAAREEAVLQVVREAAMQRLASGQLDFRKAAVTLAARAASQMAGDRLIITLSNEAGFKLDDSLVSEIAREAGHASSQITLVNGPATSELRVVVEDPAGRRRWDNTLSARLERMWPEMRCHLASQLLSARNTHSSESLR